MKLYIGLLAFLVTSFTFAQEVMNEKLPYNIIPEAPAHYTPSTVVARMVDGLGFRYFWATEGLSDENLEYKPSEEGRTIAETMDHIYSLSRTILNSAINKPTDFTSEPDELTTIEKRKRTLENFKNASDLFKVSKNLAEHKIVFIRKNGKAEFPFWNQINGPIEDAVWHAGQIVIMRRAAGNPINSKVNMFMGNVRD
jgi:uncharacterized damage-inducible protein DinB